MILPVVGYLHERILTTDVHDVLFFLVELKQVRVVLPEAWTESTNICNEQAWVVLV
jgi:hypothetical protein